MRQSSTIITSAATLCDLFLPFVPRTVVEVRVCLLGPIITEPLYKFKRRRKRLTRTAGMFVQVLDSSRVHWNPQIEENRVLSCSGTNILLVHLLTTSITQLPRIHLLAAPKIDIARQTSSISAEHRLETRLQRDVEYDMKTGHCEHCARAREEAHRARCGGLEGSIYHCSCC